MKYGWIERLRGVDKWPFVDAIAISVHQIIKGNRRGDGAWRTIRFRYRSGSRDFERRLFVDSYSSIYELVVGDHFDIQYNPQNPRQYFCNEAKSLFRSGRVLAAFVLVMSAVYGIAYEVFSR